MSEKTCFVAKMQISKIAISKRKVFAGPVVRRLREEAGWAQVFLATKLQISPSYLNQIERSQRPLSASVLVELARVFRVDISQFSDNADDRLLVDLRDALADPALGHTIQPSHELEAAIQHTPNLAKAIIRLQAAHRALDDNYQALDQTISHSEALQTPGGAVFPYEEVRDFFHGIGNYVDTLDRSAELTREELGADAAGLPGALIERLEMRHRLSVKIDRTIGADRPIRSFDRGSRTLHVDGSADASSQTFALAHQLALFQAEDLARDILRQANFRSADANSVCSVALANYFAGALVLPYRQFLHAARSHRHDLSVLKHIFGASLEQVAHRLSTLQRPGAQGIPFYFLRIDRAGNITKRHSATRLRFARYGGACPLWNVHEAFEAPDRLHVQVVEMPDGVRYLSLAQAITKAGLGHGSTRRRYAIGLGCELADGGQVVYADGLDVLNAQSIARIGISCRLCERTDCPQRAFPPAGSAIAIDPDVRRAVPYRILERPI